jgi:hypothetical protein
MLFPAPVAQQHPHKQGTSSIEASTESSPRNVSMTAPALPYTQLTGFLGLLFADFDDGTGLAM